MKRWITILTIIVFGSLLVSAQTSVADAARQAKAEKQSAPPVKHVYTNDDILPATSPAVEKKPADTAEAGDTDAKAGDEAKAGEKDEKGKEKDKKKEAEAKAAFKEKLDAQKKAIEDREKEINIMEREHQIRVAEYYADAGTQLRTGEKWFQEEKKYQDDLAAKKKALEDAKAKLDELSEQARKAGVPSS